MLNIFKRKEKPKTKDFILRDRIYEQLIELGHTSKMYVSNDFMFISLVFFIGELRYKIQVQIVDKGEFTETFNKLLNSNDIELKQWLVNEINRLTNDYKEHLRIKEFQKQISTPEGLIEFINNNIK